jgi:hypothetical protein
VGRNALGWLIYGWTEGVKRDVYWTYREVGKVLYKQEELKNMLERIKKKKKVSKDNEGMSIKKNNKK